MTIAIYQNYQTLYKLIFFLISIYIINIAKVKGTFWSLTVID